MQSRASPSNDIPPSPLPPSRHPSTVNANHYQIVRKLGRGTHGSVSLARDLTNDTLVAIKAVKRKDRILDRYGLLQQQSQKRSDKLPIVNNIGTNEKRIRREIAVMRRLSHPQIVRLIEVLDDPLEKKVYIVLEYMGGGEIEWRRPDGSPTQTVFQATRVIRDVMLGLRYLHLQDIIHRDIKPANILWSDDHLTVKITDFGISVCTFAASKHPPGREYTPEEVELLDDKYLDGAAGTPAFFAPELCPTYTPPQLNSRESSKSSITSDTSAIPKSVIDIWALGVTYYCLLFGHPPWDEGGRVFAMFKNIVEKDFTIPPTMGSDKLPTGGRHPTDEIHYPDGVPVLKILDGLLQKDPSKRMSLRELKNMPYVTQDISDPERWRKETDLQAGESAGVPIVKVTEEEEAAALTPVRWRSMVLSSFGRIKSKLGRQPVNRQPLIEPTIRSQCAKPPQHRNVLTGHQNGYAYHDAEGSRRMPQMAPLLQPSTPIGQPLLSPLNLPPPSDMLVPHSVNFPHLFTNRTNSERGTSRSRESGGLRQRVKGMIQTSLNKQSPIPTPRESSFSGCPDEEPRHSVDALRAATHTDREAMSTRQAAGSDYRVGDERMVLSEGDDNLELYSDNESSDDYGETEPERLQRELVGAGGLMFDRSLANAPFQQPSDHSYQQSPLENSRPAQVTGPAWQESVSSEEEEADDEDEAEDRRRRPSHSVYTSSESSSSDEEDQISPVEMRLRRSAISSPNGSH